jgi:hypothetical protein
MEPKMRVAWKVMYAVLPIILAGCGNDLDCASNGARDLVAQIAAEHNALVKTVFGQFYSEHPLPADPDYQAASDYASNQNLDPSNREIAGTRLRAATDKMNAAAAALEADVKKEMKYTLDTIRMTAKDQTTGAVSCAADLHGEVGRYGAAKQPIIYKVEKTSDGSLYVSVNGLHP